MTHAHPRAPRARHPRTAAVLAAAAALFGLPGAAHALPGDEDADGIGDAVDNCPTVANPAQTDANGDARGDDCVDPAAVICATAVLGYGVVVEENVTVGCLAVIGARSQLGNPLPGAFAPTTIGARVRIGPRASVDDGVALGQRTRVGADAVLRMPLEVGPNAVVGDRASLDGDIGGFSLLGDDVDLHDTPTLGVGVTVGNGSTVVGPVDVLDFTGIGQDSFLGEGGSFGPFARIGDRVGLPLGSSVGFGSVVGDDFSGTSTCAIGDFSIVRPRVTFFDVRVGDHVFIGADTSIRRGIEVGHHSVIGHDVTIDLLDFDFPPGTVILSGTTLP